jgi:hypothetical protein
MKFEIQMKIWKHFQNNFSKAEEEDFSRNSGKIRMRHKGSG